MSIDTHQIRAGTDLLRQKLTQAKQTEAPSLRGEIDARDVIAETSNPTIPEMRRLANEARAAAEALHHGPDSDYHTARADTFVRFAVEIEHAEARRSLGGG